MPNRALLHSTLLDFEIRLGRVPWRWTPAWGVLLAALVVRPLGIHWLSVITFAFVADAIWGAWWRMAIRPSEGVHYVSHLSLPYARVQAPWAQLRFLIAPGTISGLLLTGSMVTAIAYFVNMRLIWPSLLALLLALGAWWLRHLFPHTLKWLAPLYLWALPFGGGMYVLNALDGDGVLIMLSMVAGQWALLGERWSRTWWGGVSLVLWAVAILGHSPYLLGLTLALLFISLLESRGASTATDIIWILALTLIGRF